MRFSSPEDEPAVSEVQPPVEELRQPDQETPAPVDEAPETAAIVDTFEPVDAGEPEAEPEAGRTLEKPNSRSLLNNVKN